MIQKAVLRSQNSPPCNNHRENWLQGGKYKTQDMALTQVPVLFVRQVQQDPYSWQVCLVNRSAIGGTAEGGTT
jgi:hypothetical protein